MSDAMEPLSVPLEAKEKPELIRIVERFREELNWYVAERNRLMAPSPCGQKFSDGTPHPMSLWREDSSELEYVDGIAVAKVAGWPAHCLICQSEEKLRGEVKREQEEREVNFQAWKSTFAELATLREGLQGLVEKMQHVYLDFEDYPTFASGGSHSSNCSKCALASLLAPPPTARDAT